MRSQSSTTGVRLCVADAREAGTAANPPLQHAMPEGSTAQLGLMGRLRERTARWRHAAASSPAGAQA